MSSEQSEKLKLIRESERLKTKELAQLIGINYYTYHGYESGKSKMPMEAGMKLFSIHAFASIVTGSCLMKQIQQLDK